MNISLILVGKTDKTHIETGIEQYAKRIKRHSKFEIKIIKDIKNSKNMSASIQKKLEGKKILAEVSMGDQVVLLDENGNHTDSKGFAEFLNKNLVLSTKNLIFVVGGPYGFSEDVYNRANAKVSLSKMTFSHQLVRIIFAEQFYRAFCILNNKPYHHD